MRKVALGHRFCGILSFTELQFYYFHIVGCLSVFEKSWVILYVGVEVYEDHIAIQHKPEIKMTVDSKNWEDDAFNP